MEKTYKFEISHRTIIFTLLFFVFLKFLWLIKDLIFSLFIAFIIMSALKPFVNFFEKIKISRYLSALIAILIFLGVFFSLIFFSLPPLIKETTLLFRQLPLLAESVFLNKGSFLDLNSFFQSLPNLTNKIFDLIKGIFSNAVFLISTIFFSYYFTVEEDLIEKTLLKFFSQKKSKDIAGIFEKVEKRLSHWLWGELTLMFLVGLMTYIGLQAIGMPYSLALAVLAGLFEVIPNLGPTISAVPAILIGLSSSSFLGVANLALYFIVQQVENNFLVPLVMKKAVGLNPIITMMALIIGGKIAGVLGVLLAVPTAIFLETVLMEIAVISSKTS
ncbi:MAG: AI-2E family transporter [Patescibacteria group bacterium]|nr:AI-2E family transporter [Patescibacteria group bacterium]